MFIFSLSRMGMVVLLFGAKVIDSKMGAGWMGEETFVPLSSLPDFNLYPLSYIRLLHPLRLLMELCLVTRSSRGGEMVQHQPSAKDHQVEGLGPE